MNKKIAIPLLGNALSSHFGQCEKFAFINVENGVITTMTVMDPPEHLPGSYPKWVAANGATDVIAGGMGQQAINLFNGQGINVFVGAPTQKPQDLVRAFIDGTIILNENNCNHEEGHDHHHHHHQ